jgi:L-malate glycosyltransferase
MVKIAVISTMAGYSWGGSEYLWVAMAEQALLEGHEVFISISNDLSVTHSSIVQIKQQGATLLSRPRQSNPNLLSRIIRKLRQKIPALSPKSPYQPVFDWIPDIICINQGYAYEVTDRIPDLINLINDTTIPYVIIHHLNYENFLLSSVRREIARNLFSHAVYNLFVSHKNSKLVERQLAQSLQNSIVVQNPINLSKTDIVNWPYQSTICFACVARLDVAQKGQDVLFETLSSPIWQQRNWQCYLYGVGADQTYLETLSRHYGIADRVKFMGHVHDIRSIWSENHILLLPSRDEGGPPIVLVEAMLCGRPVVATDVGAVSEWLEDGQTGFIAEASTPKSFGTALDRAWQSQNNWKQMGIQAHEHAAAKLDYSPGKSLLKLILDAAKN